MKQAVLRVVDLITTQQDKKYELVARMADAVIDITVRQGCCLPQDLYAKGFAHQDVVAYWHFAFSLAGVELKRGKVACEMPSGGGALYA